MQLSIQIPSIEYLPYPASIHCISYSLVINTSGFINDWPDSTKITYITQAKNQRYISGIVNPARLQIGIQFDYHISSTSMYI
jgi:hypothetical protein